METLDAIKQIETDFEASNPPFDDVTFPEERLLDELPHGSMEGKATLLSIFSTFDYNRDANQLVDNLIELHEKYEAYFDAWHVNSEAALEERLKEVGFRYPSRDAHAWAENCAILRNKYHGEWTELYLSVGTDAVALVERLEDDDFLVLKGDKVSPMYARFVDEYIAPMSNVWGLEIPVDTHIRRLSKELFGYGEDHDVGDDRLRFDWREIAQDNNIKRHVVDGGLWQIGNNWSEWGEEYWEKL